MWTGGVGPWLGVSWSHWEGGCRRGWWGEGAVLLGGGIRGVGVVVGCGQGLELLTKECEGGLFVVEVGGKGDGVWLGWWM